jgi:hypothetical protein
VARESETSNGRICIGQSFGKAFIRNYQLFNGVILLDCRISEVVEGASHHGCLFCIGGRLIRKSSFWGRHAMDIA